MAFQSNIAARTNSTFLRHGTRIPLLQSTAKQRSCPSMPFFRNTLPAKFQGRIRIMARYSSVVELAAHALQRTRTNSSGKNSTPAQGIFTISLTLSRQRRRQQGRKGAPGVPRPKMAPIARPKRRARQGEQLRLPRLRKEHRPRLAHGQQRSMSSTFDNADRRS